MNMEGLPRNVADIGCTIPRKKPCVLYIPEPWGWCSQACCGPHDVITCYWCCATTCYWCCTQSYKNSCLSGWILVWSSFDISLLFFFRIEIFVLCYCILAMCNMTFDCMSALSLRNCLGAFEQYWSVFSIIFKIIRIPEIVTKCILSFVVD